MVGTRRSATLEVGAGRGSAGGAGGAGRGAGGGRGAGAAAPKRAAPPRAGSSKRPFGQQARPGSPEDDDLEEQLRLLEQQEDITGQDRGQLLGAQRQSGLLQQQQQHQQGLSTALLEAIAGAVQTGVAQGVAMAKSEKPDYKLAKDPAIRDVQTAVERAVKMPDYGE